MKTKLSFLALASLAALTAGCVGSGPNTTQGAVAGGALGAVAGAVIGNNTGHGGHNNALAGAAIGGVAGAVAGGAVGNSLDHQRGTIYTSEAQATTEYQVEAPPPPPPRRREVVVARPGPDVVWIEGYYAYGPRGGYEWVPGHWERPPGRYNSYVAPHWQQRGRSYVYVQGYWR